MAYMAYRSKKTYTVLKVNIRITVQKSINYLFFIISTNGKQDSVGLVLCMRYVKLNAL